MAWDSGRPEPHHHRRSGVTDEENLACARRLAREEGSSPACRPGRLRTSGIRVPGGFATTAEASNDAMMATNILVYDGRCGLCRRAAVTAVRIARRQVDLVDYNQPAEMLRVPTVGRAEAEESVVLVDCTGRKQHGYDAIAAIICMPRWLSPLCWLMRTWLARRIGPRLYREFSKRRHRLSRWLGLK